jgi:urease accessory protein
MLLRAIQTAVLMFIALLIAPIAIAHTGHAGMPHAVGLVDGFMHPLTGLEHLLITIGAGYWAARSGDHGMLGITSFLMMLLAGLLLGAVCRAYPGLGMDTLLALVLIVTVIAVAIALPEWFGLVLFGSLAFYHGIAHMLGMPVSASVAGYGTGLLFATGLLLSLGTLLRHVMLTRKPHEELRGG